MGHWVGAPDTIFAMPRPSRWRTRTCRASSATSRSRVGDADRECSRRSYRLQSRKTTRTSGLPSRPLFALEFMCVCPCNACILCVNLSFAPTALLYTWRIKAQCGRVWRNASGVEHGAQDAGQRDCYSTVAIWRVADAPLVAQDRRYEFGPARRHLRDHSVQIKTPQRFPGPDSRAAGSLKSGQGNL